MLHTDLAGSLQHIAMACADTVPDIAEALGPLLERLAGEERMPPVAFGLYYSLATALLADELAQARAAARQLAACSAREPVLKIAPRGGCGLLDQVLDDRLGADAGDFAPIDPAGAEAFTGLLQEGLALLCEGAPELHGELSALVHEIVLAQAPAGARMEFDGASHYQFWGLLLLNPRHHPTPLAVAEVLAHEAGHSLLFGLTRDEPLVHNPDDDLYPSPLRLDPRPMDGIYHATFVSARMAWVMETLADSGLLDARGREQALTAARRDRENFAAGRATLAAHGRLSATGAAIMADADAWMRAS